MAMGGIHSLSHSCGLLTHRLSLGKLAEICEGQGHIAPRQHRREASGAESLAHQFARERFHVALEHLHGLPILPKRVVSVAQHHGGEHTE